MTLTLGRLLREDVAQICAAALELAAGELFKTLRRAAFRLHFRHGLLLLSYSAGRSAEETFKAWTTACLAMGCAHAAFGAPRRTDERLLTSFLRPPRWVHAGL